MILPGLCRYMRERAMSVLLIILALAFRAVCRSSEAFNKH